MKLMMVEEQNINYINENKLRFILIASQLTKYAPYRLHKGNHLILSNLDLP